APGVFQPIRPHSCTYQGFNVSFHRALISTMSTGATETMRPVHTNHGPGRVASIVCAVTALMELLLWIIQGHVGPVRLDCNSAGTGDFSQNCSAIFRTPRRATGLGSV